MKDIKVFLKKKKQQYCCERFKCLLKEEKYKLVEYRKIIYNMRNKRLIIITRKYHLPLYKGKYKKLFFFFFALIFEKFFQQTKSAVKRIFSVKYKKFFSR